MIDDDLREHYRNIRVDDESLQRVTASVTTHIVTPPRRSRLAIGAGIAIAACIAAGVLALTAVREHHGQQSGASASTPGSSSSTRPSTTATTSTPVVAAPTRLSPKQIVATLTSLLPGRWTVRTTRSDAQNTNVDVLINDGAGAAQVSVALQYPPVHSYETKPVGCKNDGSSWPAGVCTINDAGQQVLAFKSYEYPADPSRGAKEWYLEILGRQDIKVSIHEWNAPTEKGSAQTRLDPPLTLQQMNTIATSPRWTK